MSEFDSAIPVPDFQLLFESAPALYLVLTPDFRIIAASEAYLHATMTARQQILGRRIFDVFPDNPNDPEANGVRNLTESLNRVLSEKTSDVMAVQKYDIRLPDSQGGGFAVRYWSLTNTPVVEKGKVVYIIHRAEDVTEFVQLKLQGLDQEKHAQALRTRSKLMEAEVFQRAQQIQEVNRRLREANDELSRVRAELEKSVEQQSQELRGSEERFRLLVQGVKDYAIYMLDSRGNVQSWNDGAERITGYTAEEIIGHHFSKFQAQEEAAALKPQRMLQISVLQGRYEEEGIRIRKDGSQYWAITSISPLFGNAGELLGFVKVTRDISDRRNAEISNAKYIERLRILNEIDRALIQGQGPEGIAAAALGPLRELLGVPRAIVNLFDFEKGEVEWLAAAGRRRLHVGPGVRYSFELVGDMDALRRGELQFLNVDSLPPGSEVEALRASGVHEYVVVPMIAGGELIGGLSFGGPSAVSTPEQISIAQDAATQFAIALAQAKLYERVKLQTEELERRVAERVQAEEALREANAELERGMRQLDAVNQELKEKTAENESFVYSVSHDLRSPLVNIQGFSRELGLTVADLRSVFSDPQIAEAIRDRGIDLLENSVKTSLDFIQSAVDRLNTIINALLRLSRAGRVVYQPRCVESNAIVTRIVNSLQMTIKEKHAAIQVSDLPNIMGDPSALEQIFANLIGNALNYLDPNRPGLIEIGCLPSSSSNEETRTYFIRDNGIGITEKNKEKVFQPFHRLTPQMAKGEGIGLAIVHRVVERLGGKIWFESTFGEGTTFFISFQPCEE